jgi:levanase/fructan beta-fructosidase
MLIDRTSYEIFGNDGRIAISSCYIPKSRDDEMNTSIKFISSGGQMIIRSLEVNDLRSIWDNYTYNESNLEIQ